MNLEPEAVFDQEDNRRQWETINDHLQEMLTFTDGITGGSPLSSSPLAPSQLATPQQVNPRLHHTPHNPMYRRSEGDIQGRQSDPMNLTPGPQTAPVLPEGFQLHWPNQGSPSTPTMPPSHSFPVFPHTPSQTFTTDGTIYEAPTNGNASASHPVSNEQFEYTPKPMFSPNLKQMSYPLISVTGNSENDTQHHFVTSPNPGSNSPHVIRQQSSPSIFSPPISLHPPGTRPNTRTQGTFPTHRPDLPQPIPNYSPASHNSQHYNMSPNLRRKSAPTPDSSTLISNLTRRTLSQMPNPVTPVNGLPSSMYTSSAFMPTILNEPLEKVDEIPIPTGSTGYNDEDYTKALLQHQTDRMNRLRALYGSKKTELITLNGDISILEEKIQERNRRYKSPSSVNSLQDEIGRLREVNRQLEIDCNCMYKEVDLFSRDGDSTREDFYSRYNRPPVKQQPQKQRKGSLRPVCPVQDLPPPPPPPPDDEPKWRCSHCTFDNHAALNKCEICEYPREVQSTRVRIT